MAVQTKTPSPPKSSGAGRVFTVLSGIVCFGLLGYLLFQIVHQVLVPQPPQPLILVQDIPLPSGVPTNSAQEKSLIPNGAQAGNTLNPGVAIDFDHFDFQALDVPTHRLFIAHTGPNPDLLAADKKNATFFDPTRDAPFDGHIIVFDTQRQQVIARINIPQVSGIVDAPDLGKVFAASDAATTNDQSIVYAIDVHTLAITPIPLANLESPDALSYDPVNKRIYASDPGAPADPTKTLNADRSNENIAVINAVNDTLTRLINLGNVPILPGEKVPAALLDLKNPNIPRYGHDVGHNIFDEGLQRLFVTSTILPNGDDPNPFVLSPPGTGEFFEIDPTNATNPIVKEIDLPTTCGTPHGMNLDETQQVAFIACVDVDSASNLFPNLLRVDLKTMTVIQFDPNKARLEGGPDIVRLDQNSALKLDLLFVGCKAGITIFDITPGHFHKLGDVILGKETHTIAIDEATQLVYLPLIIGGRPVLRVARYDLNGQASF